VSNGVARVAGLVVAALPLLAGLPPDAVDNPVALDRGFDVSMLICGGLFVLGGLIVWFGVPRLTVASSEPICRHHWTGCPQIDVSRQPPPETHIGGPEARPGL
jgi:hypothetical protein